MSNQFARLLGKEAEVIGLNRDHIFIEFAINKSKEFTLKNLNLLK